jgi:hypothetical protein
LGAAKDTLDDHGIFGVIHITFAQPKVGEGGQQTVQQAVNAGSAIDYTTERRDVVTGTAESGEGRCNIVIDRFGSNVGFHNGFAAGAERGFFPAAESSVGVHCKISSERDGKA